MTVKEESMLLSRIAESVYWSGRYIERVEATARLIEVHTKLFLDLPRSAGLGWSPLLLVTGSKEDFGVIHTEVGEDEVISFLAIDDDNPGSVLSSLTSARANLRVTRSVLPESAWEVLNELHLWAVQASKNAVDRRTRLAWTNGVIRRCQTLSGVMAGIMCHDASYSFLEIGRHVERADMATRVLDVESGVLVGQIDRGNTPYADLTWMSVLRSLGARQMFLRSTRAGLSGPAALRFLLKEPQFPRSVEYCLTTVSRALLELPGYDAPMAGCAAVQQVLEDAELEHLDPTGLHQLCDELQQGIGQLHELVAARYFDSASANLAATA